MNLSPEMTRVLHELKDHGAVIDYTLGRPRIRWITKENPRNKHQYNTHSGLSLVTLIALEKRGLVLRDDSLMPPQVDGGGKYVIGTYRYNKERDTND